MKNEKKIDKTICLCAIVKNEGKIIKRLIDSCREIIDYWVIIDTGSTDNSKEIIKKELNGIPGELHESKFVNFGHNRTELVQKAKGKADYLILADADFTINWNKKFDKSKLTANMYHIRYSGGLDFAQALFVSGHVDWYYKGVTHEYITSDVLNQPVELRDFWITHHFDGGTRHEKLDRDRKLLEKDIIDNPSEKRSYFYLAQTYSNLKNYGQAIKYYQERINKGGWPEEIYYSKYQIGLMLEYMKKFNEAKLAYLDAYDYRPHRFECLYTLGALCRKQKKYSQAKLYLEAVKNMPYPKNDLLFVHKIQRDVLADFELGICYYYKGEYDKAERANRKVLAYKEIDLPTKIKEQAGRNLNFALEKTGKKKKSIDEGYIVASMFTVNTPYEKEILKLKTSLDKFKIKYELIGVKDQGNWEKNTQMKPHVIKNIMKKHNKPVVWIDADAIVLKDPVFFNNLNTDISYYTINWPNGFVEKCSGTLYLANNENVHKFIDRWINMNSSNSQPDALNMQAILPEFEYLNYKPLPADYLKIFDNVLIVAPDPVIVHNQASRRFKKEVSIKTEAISVRDKIQPMITGKDACSIIGNGPFKTNLSKEINHSFIMRCNNFKVGVAYKGIGTRTDLNISSLFHEIIPTKKVDYPVFGILPISDTLYQKYTTAKQMHKYWVENAVKLAVMEINVFTYGDVDEFAKVFSIVAEEINAFPSVGIMAIMLARFLHFKKIIITGFTFFESEKSHYFMNDVVIPSSHHNMQAEKESIRKWIESDKEYNPEREYILDELMKEKLYEDASIESVTVK